MARVISVALLLESFRLPGSEFRLSDTIRLRRCGEDELSALGRVDRFAVLDGQGLAALEGQFDSHEDTANLGHFRVLRRHVEKAALALRLTFPGTLGWRMACFSSPQQGAYEVFPRADYGSLNALGEGEVQVSPRGLSQAAELWCKTKDVLLSLNGRPYLAVALDRFSDSYARANHLDKVLDLVICLEALVPEGPGRGKGKRIARLVAPLIVSEAPHLRQSDARQAVESLYETRNAVVHGENVKVDAGQVLSWKDRVRQCLRGYLEKTAAGAEPAWLERGM
ncbi:MAG: HEPN domain-containing protein [Candidatus Bipolaricaulota bacterium]|nr:HEPN domain-containing protein [Candidatus Bipolaricaulota bacterium]